MLGQCERVREVFKVRSEVGCDGFEEVVVGVVVVSVVGGFGSADTDGFEIGADALAWGGGFVVCC